MNKKLFFILFGLFVLLLLPHIGIASSCECNGEAIEGPDCDWSACGWGYEAGLIGESKSCLIRSAEEFEPACWRDKCSNYAGKCKVGECPDYSGWNGENCYLRTGCWLACEHWGNRWEAGESNLHEINLKWDASEKQCVKCVGNLETRLYGDTDRIYVGCDDESIDITDKCESACGADSRCDEVSPGEQGNCPSGQRCGDPSCQCVAGPLPDLIITDVRQDGSTVKYSIKNQGNALAGSSTSYLYVDGSHKASDSVPSLSAGASSNNESFSYTWTCSGSSDTIEVCADRGFVVSESIEGNNCLMEEWDCPKPDLYIEDFWDDDGSVRYTVRNGGEADAESTSYTKLYVDGVFKESEDFPPLNAGSWGTKSFDYDWIENCTGESDTIKVCADDYNDIDESNEGNNCRTETWNCLKPDLTITDVWFSSDRKVLYYIYNEGEVEADSSQSSLEVNGSYQTYDPVNSLSAGSYREENFANWTCTAGQTYSIEVCADRNDSVDEENENNNCHTETLDCPGECTGILNVSISGSGTCTVTASLTATLCSGKSWQVRDNGNTKCSGTVSGSPYYYTCSTWTVGAGNYLYRLYIDGAVKDGKSVNCSETPNEPPTCNYLDASPDSGNAPLNVSFTGSGSDSDGNIVEYQLDFDGDGEWDYTGSVSPAEPNPVIGYNYTYDNAGTYPAKLRFKDDDGAWSDVPSACTQVIEVTSFAEEALDPPVVITGEANLVEATSVTLNGELVDLGYDLAECSSCSCIVWFEWGTSGTEGVSGSYGNSTAPVSMTAAGPFTEVISGLSSGITYYFEAFAKNGGSW
jgi:hypothetical protein